MWVCGEVIDWLFEAKKRYGLTVFNYMVTSNHVHLLVYDNHGREAIARSIQLIAGRTGQAYNVRKQRKGTFWEDRYHATAIEKDTHLKRCLVYMDLNSVLAILLITQAILIPCHVWKRTIPTSGVLYLKCIFFPSKWAV